VPWGNDAIDVKHERHEGRAGGDILIDNEAEVDPAGGDILHKKQDLRRADAEI
jgi:hypothetical protein